MCCDKCYHLMRFTFMPYKGYAYVCLHCGNVVPVYDNNNIRKGFQNVDR